ncbi:AhpC/TSA family protein [Hymenobacter sp. 5317J-9]|uniref:peroxiredoxin-like family protein n=1 Tax=Hymenobacter sp. 5317J-9 TaxID=2932250 RepID=UPI001FD6F7B8|nr:peroxiredoxin-like family protein [Hymenobacter sp. 5317J-9]UOQ97270.1 AhpC/TSA family protein [Hymenobacter sp. 5317J-9]
MSLLTRFTAALALLASPALAQSSPTPALTASALAVGSVAPAFKGQDAAGRPVELRQLLKKGPVVLYFYRGQWCPYCNKELSQLQDSLQVLTAKGAQVVVVTPETPANIGQTVAKTKASFPIVHDRDLTIMKAYKTAFVVDDATATKYLGYGIDLKKANGLDQNILPVPATYVIGRDGTIRFAYFNPDYRQRVSVRQVARAL